jgi:Cys-Gly metallodipeptidase DUG1
VSKLVTSKGEILIPGIKEMVAPLTDEERARYEAIHAEVSDFDDAVGAAITLHDDKVNTVSLHRCVSSLYVGLGLSIWG